MGAAQNQGTVTDLDLQHPYLLNCKTRTNETGTDLLATIPAQLPTYKKWKEQLDSFSHSLNTSKYLLLAKGHSFDEGGVCSTSGELHLEYEYFPRLLTSQIGFRKREGKRFTEGQLWYLLFVLSSAKYALAESGEVIGDVQPRNVFLNGTGEVKIACLRSWPGQVSNYRKAVLEEDCGYLAPEDIDRLLLGAMDNQNNTQSQIFSIGLVLLSTATLQLQNDLYNMKDREFDQGTFSSRVQKFQHDPIYSEIFRAVVSNLLEVEPLKRMNCQQLYAFLEKHTDNIVAKRPLKIDNVGKKLQITINIILKAIHSKNKGQKPSIPNQGGVSASPTKPGITPAIMNHINFEQKRPSQTIIIAKSQPVIEASSQKAPVINQFPNSFNQQSHPALPQPAILINRAGEQPHRPAISKTFSSTAVGPVINKTQSFDFQSPAKYKPFEIMASKGGAVFQVTPIKRNEEPKILNQEPSIEQIIASNQQIKKPSEVKKQGDKGTTAAQIWMGEQTSIGQLNLLMQTNKSGGFDHNSLINPKYEPESVEVPLHSNSLKASHESSQRAEERMVSQVKEEAEEEQQQPSSLLASKDHQQLRNQSEAKESEQSSRISNPKTQKKGSEDGSQIDKIQEKELLKEQQKQKNNSAVPAKQSNFNKIQVIQLQTNNEFKLFSPSVKVWGMKMGLNQPKPEQAQNVRQVQVSSSKTSEKLAPASLKYEIPKPIPNLSSQQNEIPKANQSQGEQDLKKASEQDLKKASDLLSHLQLQSKEQISHAAGQSNNYILIQEDSRHQKDPETSEHRQTQAIKEQLSQKESHLLNYHTYAEIVTEATFQQCWQEILTFLRDPSEYSSQIDSQKVKIRVLNDRWSLKVGPGIFDIFLNKQQGKFLLKNCEESRCQGQMLGGVYKDEQKKHRIWFNSAYYYNGLKVPSKEVVEECLKKAKDNIEHAKQ